MWASRRDHAVEGWTAVVFPRDRVEIARVRPRTGDRPAVAAWESFALQGGELDAIKRLRGAKKFGDTRCTTLLQHGDYQFLQTEKPDIPHAEMRDAIRWRIKEQVDFPIEQAVIDVLDIPGQGGGRAPQMFVVAAGADRVAPRIHLFQDAKVDLAAIDIPELALRNIAALFEQEGHGLALLAFDTAGGYLIFTYQGELLAARFIDVRRDDLAAAKAGEGGLYDKVLLDVQRSLDNFERAHSYAPLTRVLVSALPGGNDFIDYLKSNLYQPVEMLDLSSVLDLTAVPTLAEPVRQAEALLAIGAAMRTGAGAQ